MDVLDPAQLARIEGLHRGFLYQHLYAAGCLLLAGKAKATRVLVERDEDGEVELADRRLYVQVKTRSEALTYGDIKGALDRFDALRKQHAAGTRAGTPQFFVVTNAAIGPDLTRLVTSSTWARDVGIVVPGVQGPDAALPPAWKDIPSAVAWLSDLAKDVPFSMLAPETLVWKLAGRIQLACTGIAPHQDHAFEVEGLSKLFEQVAESLQDFPAPPAGYRPQDGEPNLVEDKRVRMIAGFSGAGKTAWASQAALHTAGVAVYLDIADIAGPVVAMSLARELAVRLYGQRKGGLGEVLLPGASGLELLRSLDRRLDSDGLDAVAVIDNVHKAPPEDLASIIKSTGQIKFVFLGQPGEVCEYLEKAIEVPVESLKGWSVDTVAAEAAARVCKTDFKTSQRIKELTGGLPLYVQSALRVCASDYSGDVARLCADLEEQKHTTTTAQEAILSRLFSGLPQQAHNVAGILSEAGYLLTRMEAEALAKATLGLEQKDFAMAIRILAAQGCVQVFGGGHLKVHDAVRVLGRARIDHLGHDIHQKTRQALKEVLSISLVERRDPTRFAHFVKLLGETGDTDILVDLAGSEFFHEMGLAQDFRAVLDKTATDTSIPAVQRFWALDALVFAELRDKGVGKTPERIEAMRKLVDEGNLGEREKLEVASKQMLLAGKQRDEKAVLKALAEAQKLAPNNPEFLRIIKYNAAASLFMVGQHHAAHELVWKVVQEYYEHLGLDPHDVFAMQPEDIFAKLKKGGGLEDDLKHLADSLDLYARSANAIGHKSGLARVHAMKFYSMAGATDSAFKVGQDFVDELVASKQYEDARKLFETSLLPSVYAAKIADRVVPLRSQYAVILAYYGDFKAAENEMNLLTAYETGLSEDGQKELQNQRRLIAQLKALPPAPRPIISKASKHVGRNDPCPCGSGKKHKKCCGK